MEPAKLPPSLPAIEEPMPGVGEVMKTAQSDRDATARIIAKWLDELIPIPGTNFRIGLEPIMALFPGVGEFLASSVSLVTIVEAVRTGVSPSVVGRMGVNMIVNALIGLIPGAGAPLSAFFKSNSRNLMLLRRWQEGEKQELKKGSRWILGGIVFAVFSVFALLMIVWAFYFWTLFKLFTGLTGDS